MSNHAGQATNTLSEWATYWYYLGLVLALLPNALLLAISGHGILFEPKREFFMHLMIVLASLNGLIAILLILRRKLAGAYWSLVPLPLLCVPLLDLGPRSGYGEGDLVPMALLGTVPVAALVSQISALRKLHALEPDHAPRWGLGPMAYSDPKQDVSRAAPWWFRAICALSFLIYMGVLMAACGQTICEQKPQTYSVCLAALAGVSGLFGVWLFIRKEPAGVAWSVAPCVFLGLGAMDIGLGEPNPHFTDDLLLPAFLAFVLLLSQIGYLLKQKKRSP